MDWKNRIHMIQNKVKFQLHARGLDDLESIALIIQEFDTDNSGSLDKVEFTKFLAKSGIFLTTQELTCVYTVYDTNKDGKINYAEFIQMIRTEMSEKRLSVVKHAFNFLDVNKSKALNINNLVIIFKAEAHPRVRTRQKTVEQVKTEFLKAILKKSKDGQTVTETEFLEYYADVNASLPHEKEEYFVDLVLKTWGITTSYNYVSPERIADLELILYEKIRQKTHGQNDEGKTVKKAFHYFDLEDKGVITLDKFTQALDKFGCVFNQYEIQALFKKYDKEGAGRIPYDEFCNLFATMGSGLNPNVNPVFQLSREAPADVLTLLVKELKKRGLYAFRNLSVIMKKLDKTRSGKVKRSEFTWGIKEAGQNLTKHDLDKLFKFFDKQCEDNVKYLEFLQYVNGYMGESRRQLVQETFASLSNGADSVSHDWLKNNYNPAANPCVRAGRRKADDDKKEFINLWDNVKKDGTVSYSDFEEYYNDVSAGVDSDELFYAILSGSFCAGKKDFTLTKSELISSPTKINGASQNLGNTQNLGKTTEDMRKTDKLRVTFADDKKF